MKTKQIEAFKVVMESGSMTAAADKLFVTQPAVTKLIAQLEHDIKMPLFERSKGRIEPTEDAKIFYQHVLRTFEALENLDQIAKDIKGLNRGRLIIAALPLLSTNWLPNQCTQFIEGKETVNLSLHSHSSTKIQDWIISGQADLGIGMIADSDRVNAELLAEVEAVCILPQGHPLSEKDTISPEDLNGETFILTGGVDGTRQRLEGLFKALNVSVNKRFEAIFSSTTCSFVAAGAGVSLVNAYSAAEFSHLNYEIRRFRPKISFQIFLLTARNRRMSRLAEEFAARLLESAKDDLNMTID